jgi:hypothetical protein
MFRQIEFENIVALPGRHGPPPTNLPLMGGVQFPQDAPDWCFNLRGRQGGRIAGGRPPLDDVPLQNEKLSGTYVYGGFMHPHFGHMISEFMHRLWLLEKPEFQDTRPVFIDMSNRAGEKLLRNALSLMRLPEPLIVDTPMEIARLVVGEPGRVLRGTTMPGYNDFLERRLGYLRGSGKRHPPRLAVLRGHLGKPRCLGEQWLERELVREGYFAFRPEEYTLREQIEHYLDAKKIIFSEGSAIHLIDILPILNADVVVLNRRTPGLLAQTTLAGKCASLHLFDGQPMGDPRLPIGSGFNGISWVDMPAFVSFLKERGFICALPAVSFFDDPVAVFDDLDGYLRVRKSKASVADDPATVRQMINFLVRGTGVIIGRIETKNRAIAARRAAVAAAGA